MTLLVVAAGALLVCSSVLTHVRQWRLLLGIPSALTGPAADGREVVVRGKLEAAVDATPSSVSASASASAALWERLVFVVNERAAFASSFAVPLQLVCGSGAAVVSVIPPLGSAHAEAHIAGSSTSLRKASAEERRVVRRIRAQPLASGGARGSDGAAQQQALAHLDVRVRVQRIPPHCDALVAGQCVQTGPDAVVLRARTISVLPHGRLSLLGMLPVHAFVGLGACVAGAVSLLLGRSR